MNLKRGYKDREAMPKPGDDPNDFSGLAGQVRAEYGRHLYESTNEISFSLKNRFVDLLPGTMGLEKELLKGSGTMTDAEIFGQIFSLVTHPRYNPNIFPQWVNTIGDMIFEELGIER
jgi:hypothetical protein